MKKLTILMFFLVTTYNMLGQGLHFSFQMGVAVPSSDFAKNDVNPENGGFAVTGFDIRFIAERSYKNNIIIGLNVGYAVFGVDKEAIRNFINPSYPEGVQVETQAFQNINVQFRTGYDFSLFEEKMHLIPFIDAGLGIFNSAYYFVKTPNGTSYYRAGNTGVGFLISPGLDFLIGLNEIVNLKIYSSYQFANYNIDESFKVVSGNDVVIDNHVVSYKYSGISAGLGVVFIF